MKVLLDEGIDPRLIRSFQLHEVLSMKRMGWLGIKNGELLSKAEHEFDALLTVDKNIPFEQNLKDRKLIVVILRVQNLQLATLIKLVSQVEIALNAAELGQLITIG